MKAETLFPTHQSHLHTPHSRSKAVVVVALELGVWVSVKVSDRVGGKIVFPCLHTHNHHFIEKEEGPEESLVRHSYFLSLAVSYSEFFWTYPLFNGNGDYGLKNLESYLK